MSSNAVKKGDMAATEFYDASKEDLRQEWVSVVRSNPDSTVCSDSCDGSESGDAYWAGCEVGIELLGVNVDAPITNTDVD